MTDEEQRKKDIASLEADLKRFREEKEKVRQIIGEVGGKKSSRRDRMINIFFVALLLGLLGVDIIKHAMEGLNWLPSMVSLEIGVLLVSLKIIWMIHKQAKVEHFQFWILNSIEFRLTELNKRLAERERDESR
jgi:hypothetical protein